MPGPGADLFDKAQQELGPLQFIAEDLGAVTEGVEQLRNSLGFPGLRILQFSFGSASDDDEYKPHKYPRNCVVYTGTHDNDTTVGWFRDAGGPASTRTHEQIEQEHRNVLRYLKTEGQEIHWDLIQAALDSPADTALFPMQDLLGLGSEARMNIPGTAHGNWRWRMQEGAFTEGIVNRLAKLTENSNRRTKVRA
jgi:4-alpha-glucanotransferase